MRSEDTMQFMMDFYPDIFPTRKHCLNHLFCVIGNGYEWINGELVNKDDTFERRYKIVESMNKAKPRDEDFYNNMLRLENELKEVMGEDYKINHKYSFEWYPLCKEYSKLYTYPENITDDWMELLNECKEMLIKDAIEV